MTIRSRLGRTAAVAAALGVASTAAALDLVQGYERGANRLDQLGDAFIFDEAATGGGDASIQTAPASFGWVAEYDDLWDVGTSVSLTGLAIPIQSNSNALPNSTSGGDWTFTFFELSGGADPNSFDGYDFGTMTGEPIIGSITATIAEPVGNQTDEYFVAFDTPIDFTSASTGLAFHMQTTGTARLKVNTPGATRRAQRVSLTDGTVVAGTNSSFAATLAGTPVAFPPPPPPSLSYRFDAALDNPATRRWESVDPTLEQFAFNLPQPGDYNNDGFTNAADYTLWRDNDGGDADTLFAAGSRDPGNAGPINAADGAFWQANYGSPTTVPVNDPAVPGITRAFDRGATGQANVYENAVGGLQASRQDGSFEIWFKPDDLAGGDQVLFEIGGSGTGSYLSLNGDQLSFYINGQFDGNEQTVTTTLTDADWTQVAVVINNTFEATLPSSDDFIDLYVDGVLAASSSATPTDINRWAGGNQAGLGQVGGNVAANGPLADSTGATPYTFEGEIAIFEYAPATAWDSNEVLARYNAITGGASAIPEPTSAMLVVIGLGYGVSRRRR